MTDGTSETARPEEAKQPKRKRFGCMKVVLYLFLMLVVLVLIWSARNFRPAVKQGQPLLPVSAELTILTEPLDENGDVDYLEALNQQYSAGVTTDSNAMVKFAQALGPQAKSLDINAEFCQRIGIPELPTEPLVGKYFVPFNQWCHEENVRIENERFRRENPGLMGADVFSGESEFEQDVADTQADAIDSLTEPAKDEPAQKNEPDEINDPFRAFGEFDGEEGVDEKASRLARLAEDEVVQFAFVGSNPWSAEQFPAVEKWLQDNAIAFQDIEEGLRRPDYYHPMVSGGLPKMMNVQLIYTEQYREVARYLAVRALLNLQRGDIEKSIDDVDRMFRFAELTSSGPTIVEELVGIAIAGMAKECAIQIAIHEKTTAAQLEQLQQRLANIKPIGGLAERINKNERYAVLDLATLAGRSRLDETPFGGMDGTIPTARLLCSTADFEEVVTVVNDQYDMCVEIVDSASVSAEARETAEQEFYSLMKQQEIECVDPWQLVKMVLAGRKAKGIWLGRFVGNMMVPSIFQLIEVEIRTKSKLEMVRIYVAVCRFKKENGRLPESLDDLKPKFIDVLAKDGFTDRPFVFGTTEGGFWIHSDLWSPPVVDEDGQLDYEFNNGNTIYALWPRRFTWEEFLEDY